MGILKCVDACIRYYISMFHEAESRTNTFKFVTTSEWHTTHSGVTGSLFWRDERGGNRPSCVGGGGGKRTASQWRVHNQNSNWGGGAMGEPNGGPWCEWRPWPPAPPPPPPHTHTYIVALLTTHLCNNMVILLSSSDRHFDFSVFSASSLPYIFPVY